MSSKRRREDDSDSEECDGYGYDRQQLKKSRTWFSSPPQTIPSQGLQLRPSPTPPRTISDIETMTPAQSEHGGSPNIAWGGPVRSSQSTDYDMDMDEDDFDMTIQPAQSPNTSSLFMRPAMLNASLFGADPVNSSSRIPTPIHPTFKRGGMNGFTYPTSGSAGGYNTSTGGVSVPALQTPTSRKAHRQECDDDRSRRMPSPISEDEDIPDTPTALTQSQLSRLSVSQADQMDMEDSPAALAPPPTPRGRKRSGALTGMGRYSMGFRPDCEKCQQRIPGHFSHFL
ncbi:hypothetical protein CC86DRAFT_404754 [Ophiobolus disseminans]|uniref:Uncharacterized protein n=1 Tax=Ophiobolus disseminans TaxID=1469910 RepID=A0A6A7A6F8_9PLEO|nr:hypothetical protein CC86DRAFT_404754 [Ophiobolus disseminans]